MAISIHQLHLEETIEWWSKINNIESYRRNTKTLSLVDAAENGYLSMVITFYYHYAHQ